MAEEESDQEAERLGEELVAIVESPPGPVGLLAAGDGRGGAGGGGCGGGVGISSRDYCRRFCQVRRPSAAPTCHWAPGPLRGSWPAGPGLCVVSGTGPPAGRRGSLGSPGPLSAPLRARRWGRRGVGLGVTCGLGGEEKVSLSRRRWWWWAGSWTVNWKAPRPDMPVPPCRPSSYPRVPPFSGSLPGPSHFCWALPSFSVTQVPPHSLFQRRQACYHPTACPPVIATPPPLLGSPVIPSLGPSGPVLPLALALSHR
jgi:hypothetical protein